MDELKELREKGNTLLAILDHGLRQYEDCDLGQMFQGDFDGDEINIAISDFRAALSRLEACEIKGIPALGDLVIEMGGITAPWTQPYIWTEQCRIAVGHRVVVLEHPAIQREAEAPKNNTPPDRCDCDTCGYGMGEGCDEPEFLRTKRMTCSLQIPRSRWIPRLAATSKTVPMAMLKAMREERGYMHPTKMQEIAARYGYTVTELPS